MITARRAPPSSRCARLGEEAIEPFELAVDPDAQRLEGSRRRVDALVAAPRDRARARPAPAPPVVRIGVSCAARRRSPARCAASTAPRRTGRSRWRATPRRSRPATRPRSRPCERSIRMSSGSSRRKLKPRPSASSCIDETPRSASAPSTPVEPALVEHPRQVAIVGVHQLDAVAEVGERTRRPAAARQDRDRARGCATRRLRAARAQWPPRPTVQSTNSPPRAGASSASVSATITGSCVGARHALRSRIPPGRGRRRPYRRPAGAWRRSARGSRRSSTSYWPNTSTSPAMPAASRSRWWITTRPWVSISATWPK